MFATHSTLKVHYKNNVWFAGSTVLFFQQVVFLLVGLLAAAFLASTAEALVKSIHAPNAPDSLTAKYYLNEYMHVAGQGWKRKCAAISNMSFVTGSSHIT